MAATTFESALVADGALAVFAPDPATGAVVDRTGNYTATLQNGGTVTSDVLVPRAPGAISLDGSNDYVSTTFGTRRNLVSNPSFERATTGYFASGTNTIATSAAQAFAGTQSLKVTYQNTLYSSGLLISALLATTTTYWLQARVYIPSDWDGGAVSIDDGGELVGKTVVDATNQSTTTKGSWVWLRWKITTAADIVGNLYFRIASAPTAGKFFYVDCVCIEASTASTCPDYFDGSGYVNASGTWVPATDVFRTDLGDTVWTGTAHASTSTRAGRTNLVKDPASKGGGTGGAAQWISANTPSTFTLAAVSDHPITGVDSALRLGMDSNGDAGYLYFDAVSGTTYTVSLWVKITSITGAGSVAMYVYNNAWTLKANTSNLTGPVGVWRRWSLTFTASTTDAHRLTIGTGLTSGTAEVYATAALAEASSSVNSWFCGSGSHEHRSLSGWTGAEHASASDCGVFANGTTRTVLALIDPDAFAARQAIVGSSAGTGPFMFTVETDRTLAAWATSTTGGAAAATPKVSASGATLVALEFDEPGNVATFRVNGGTGEVETLGEQILASAMLVLGIRGSSSNPLDGLVGPVAILDRAPTSAQHRAYAELSLRGDPVISIREPAPAYQITATSAGGLRSRWAADEADPDRVPSGETWTTSMPGGSDTLTCSLPRDPERSYSDLGLLTDLQVIRDGGRGLRYRLDEAPKVSGDQMVVEPAARGYRAALEDRADVRALFVDRGLSNWTDVSRGYRIAILGSGYIPVSAGSFYVDPNGGIPGIMQEVAFSGTHKPYAGNRYDAGEGLKIGSIYYNNAATGYTPPSASLAATVSVHPDPDTATGGVVSGDLEGTTSGTFTASTPHRYATAEFFWSGTAVTADAVYQHRWGQLAVYGDHNLTKYGTPGSFYTGQMLGWLIANRVGGLTAGTIEDGSFAHPHAAYTDPSTALAIVENLSRYEPLYDWFAFTDEFNFQRRGTYGKRWRARVGPSGLRSTGQTIDRAWNEVAVRVQDPAYGDRIVGPPDSAYSTTSADLRDDGDDNPATAAGVTRRALLDIGEGTIAGATEVGKRFLEETKAMDFAGQCALVGYVEDDAGIMFPVDEVRAGDEISFTDSTDPSWRRVSATSFVRATQTNSLTLDSPAPTMDALLARLQAVLIPLN